MRLILMTIVLTPLLRASGGILRERGAQTCSLRLSVDGGVCSGNLPVSGEHVFSFPNRPIVEGNACNSWILCWWQELAWQPQNNQQNSQRIDQLVNQQYRDHRTMSILWHTELLRCLASSGCVSPGNPACLRVCRRVNVGANEHVPEGRVGFKRRRFEILTNSLSTSKDKCMHNSTKPDLFFNVKLPPCLETHESSGVIHALHWTTILERHLWALADSGATHEGKATRAEKPRIDLLPLHWSLSATKH